MYLKIFVFSVLLCNVFCQFVDSNALFSYELPDNDKNKSLNVTIDGAGYQFQITVECYNYDSLKYFEVRLGEVKEFPLRGGIVLHFTKCFNNDTNNGNYNYGLSTWFNSLPYYNNEYQTGYPITIKLEEYAEVNSDTLFKYFDFKKFNSVSFINLGFTSTKFLTNLYCQSCVFENTGRIDFNDFSDSIADANWIQIKFTKLINLNRDNLKNFEELVTLDISDFDLDDINAFNVPDLFQHNVNISQISLERSKEKITLHEHVFRGLTKLQRIVFNGLQMDYIPKDLFKDLEELYTVSLTSNKIKTLDPTTFQTNKKLSYVSLTDNPLFTEPHEKLDAFDFNGESIRLDLGNFTAHTIDLLEQLIRNPKIREVTFQSFLIDAFNITEFTKIHAERDSVIDIRFQSGEPTLDLELIKSFGNIIRSEYDLANDNKLNTVIYIKFSGDAICHDCTMIKHLFPHFLKRYQNRPGFYFEDSRLFIEFVIPDSCNHLEDHNEETFDENCPSPCACKFNSLIDKVKINCNNKNLTDIPHIPYPVQFEKLRSINLDFENNSISVVPLSYQDAKVLEKLSTLNLKNNKIKTIKDVEENVLINIWALNLCGNPIITSDSYTTVVLGSGTKFLTDYYCNADDEFQRVVDYLQENESIKVDEYLNGLKCK